MESEDAHASPGEQPVPVAALSSAAYRRLAFRVVSGYVPQSTFVWSEKDSATLIGLMVKAAKDKLPRDQVLSLDPRVIREKEKNPRVEILLGVTPVTLSWIHHNEDPRFAPIRTFLATAGIVTQEGVRLTLDKLSVVETLQCARVCVLHTRAPDDMVRAAFEARGVPSEHIIKVSQSVIGSTGVQGFGSLVSQVSI